MLKKCTFVVMLMLALALALALSAPRAGAQLFGGGQDNEKILQNAYTLARQGSRLSEAKKFAESLAVYEKAIAMLEEGIKANEKLSSESLGEKDDGPSGDQMLENFKKVRAQLLDIQGKGALNAEELVHDVWDGYEYVKRDFSGANSDFEELVRWLTVNVARLEAGFARRANLKTSVIPNQGRVETTGAQLLKTLQTDLAGAAKELAKRRPKGAAPAVDAPAGGKEPTTTQRRQLSEYLSDLAHKSETAREPSLDQRESSLTDLSGAADEIDKLLQEFPALGAEPILLNSGEPSNVTGAQLTAKYRQEHDAIVKLRAQAAAEEALKMPIRAAQLMEEFKQVFDAGLKDLTTNSGTSKGFLPLQMCEGRGYQLLVNTAATLAQIKGEVGAAYKDEGKPMPATVLAPLQSKIAKMKSLIDQRAPSYSFAQFGFNVSIASLNGDLQKIVGREYPGAQMVKAGFDDKGWEILKNDLGITTGRRRDGALLYKVPGEKWHRLYYISYYQPNVAGTTFSGDGSIIWMTFRFQTAK